MISAQHVQQLIYLCRSLVIGRGSVTLTGGGQRPAVAPRAPEQRCRWASSRLVACERVGDLREAQDEHSRLSRVGGQDRKSTRLNSSHSQISYAVFCLK